MPDWFFSPEYILASLRSMLVVAVAVCTVPMWGQGTCCFEEVPPSPSPSASVSPEPSPSPSPSNCDFPSMCPTGSPANLTVTFSSGECTQINGASFPMVYFGTPSNRWRGWSDGFCFSHTTPPGTTVVRVTFEVLCQSVGFNAALSVSDPIGGGPAACNLSTSFLPDAGWSCDPVLLTYTSKNWITRSAVPPNITCCGCPWPESAPPYSVTAVVTE